MQEMELQLRRNSEAILDMESSNFTPNDSRATPSKARSGRAVGGCDVSGYTVDDSSISAYKQIPIKLVVKSK